MLILLTLSYLLEHDWRSIVTLFFIRNFCCVKFKKYPYLHVKHFILKKMTNIAISATYYIFCCRIRNWDSPDLMQLWFFFSFFGFCFVSVVFIYLFFVCLCVNLLVCFIFNNTISSSICKLLIHSEIYNCTFKNTNKISIIIIIIIIIIINISIKLRGAPYPELVKSKCRAFMISMKKKKRFSSRPGTKVSHQVLPEHSLDIHTPDFKVLQPALRHIFCVIVCFWFTGKWTIQDMWQMKVWKKIRV